MPEGIDRFELADAGLVATFAAKVVYVYASTDPGHEGLLKIGDATARGLSDIDGLPPNSEPLNSAAEARIRSYTRTQGAAWQLLHTELAIRTIDGKRGGFRDYDVHAVLRNSGIEQVRPNGSTSREWFRTDLETAVKAIAAVKHGRLSLGAGEVSTGRTPFAPRPEQDRFIKETIRAFKHADRYLWNAKMRFGKTVTALELVRRMKFKKTIIVTHRPVVNKGWFENFRDKVFVRPDDNYVYGSKDMAASLDEICGHGARNLVYFASIQDLRGSSAVGGRFEKNDEIFATRWDCVIVDEAHEGTRTALGEAVIRRLFPEKRDYPAKLLALSGTPFNILDSYREGVSTWDYVMEQAAKRDWPLLHGGDSNPYETLPKLTMFVYDLAAELEGYKSEDVRGTVFNFKEFFRVWTGDQHADHAEAPPGRVGCFVHEADVRRFLDLLVSPSASSCFPFASDENRRMFKHTFWLVPGVKEALALQRLIEGHGVLGFFKVLNVAGDGDPEDPSGEALKAVQDGIAANEYTITLSCGKLTTGVTVPEWTAVLMLAGRYETSAIRYLQTIFRVQSPSREGAPFVKENCYVFDFAPDRTLKVVADTARLSDSNRGSGGDDSDRRAAMGALLNFCPVISIRGSVMRRFDSDALMQELKRAFAVRAIMSGFADDSIYDDDMLRADSIDIGDFERLRKILKNAKIDEVPQDRFRVNRHGLTEEERDKARRAQRKNPRDLSDEEKELLRRLREERDAKRNFKATLRAISVRMPLMLYGADGDWDEDISLDRFVELVDDESWAEFMPSGVTKPFFEKFKKYYDRDIFALSARNVRRQAQGADDLFPEERIQVLAEIFDRFRNPDKETVLTPWRTVNRQLAETLGGYVFFSPDFKVEMSVPCFVDQGEVTAATLANPDAKILEINSKTGLYPLYAVYSLYRAKLPAPPATVAEANEIWDAVCGGNMFVLALTPMAASITRRTLVGYRNASTRIKVMPKLIKRLKGNARKVASEIRKGTTWGAQDVIDFDAVVGNPPYQIGTDKVGGQQPPIYQYFVNATRALCPRYISLITPSRWFAGGIGLDSFRDSMLHDRRICRIVDFTNSKDCFPDISIGGGVSYFLWNRDFCGDCHFTNTTGIRTTSRVCRLDEYPSLIRYNDGISIVNKIHTHDEAYLDSIISPLMPFGLPTNYRGVREPSTEKCIRLISSGNDTFISENEIKAGQSLLGTYKVLVSKMAAEHAGEPDKDGRFRVIPSTMRVIGPNVACTHSYFVMGKCIDKEEACNILSYAKTSFVRFLMLLAMSSVNLSKQVFVFVPLQNFTSPSDIDWSRPIPDIDELLFDKYDLSPVERNFIKSMIKPME